MEEFETFKHEICLPTLEQLFLNTPHDLIIGFDNSPKIVTLHKIILSAFSPFFKTIFESDANTNFSHVILNEIDPNLFEKIKSYIYFGETELSNRDLQEFHEVLMLLDFQIERAMPIRNVNAEIQPNLVILETDNSKQISTVEEETEI